MPAISRQHAPRTAAWVARFSEEMEKRGRGAQSELARYLCDDPNATKNQIIRWVSMFGRWKKGTDLPSFEAGLAIDEWLKAHKPKKSRQA